MNNNYYEWIKQCNQKAEIVSLGGMRGTRFTSMQFIRVVDSEKQTD